MCPTAKKIQLMKLERAVDDFARRLAIEMKASEAWWNRFKAAHPGRGPYKVLYRVPAKQEKQEEVCGKCKS